MKIQEQALEVIEINPATPAQHSVIWLHGLGADGNDFAPIVPELNLSPELGVRFVFPHAPIMPVTINNGYEMRAWFDIYGVTIDSQVDEAGIANSKAALEALIASEEARGIRAENIILAGFSQGAVVALTTGLTFPKTLGGMMALSGFLPLPDAVLEKASEANRATPIFIAHGELDAVVPYQLGDATARLLKEKGYPVAWHHYAMEHSVCAEEIRAIGAWITKVWG